MYEITFITKDGKDPGLKKLIESLGGKIIKNFPPERKKFSYPIKKESAGFYTTYFFESRPENIQELDKKLKLEEEILRHLITQKITRLIKEKPIRIKKQIAPEQAVIKKEAKKPFVGEKMIEKPPTVEKIKFEKKKETKPVKTEAPKVIKKIKEVMPQRVETGPAPKARREVEVTEDERLKALEDKLSELLKE